MTEEDDADIFSFRASTTFKLSNRLFLLLIAAFICVAICIIACVIQVLRKGRKPKESDWCTAEKETSGPAGETPTADPVLPFPVQTVVSRVQLDDTHRQSVSALQDHGQTTDHCPSYCSPAAAQAGKQYVIGVKEHRAEDPSMLSFGSGNVITLTVSPQSLGKGWLFGSLSDRAGRFPEEYVRPLSSDEARIVRTLNRHEKHEDHKQLTPRRDVIDGHHADAARQGPRDVGVCQACQA